MSDIHQVNAIRTLFFTEGNKLAVLVVNDGGRRIYRKSFVNANVALNWCRRNGAMLVYTPLNLAGN